MTSNIFRFDYIHLPSLGGNSQNFLGTFIIFFVTLRCLNLQHNYSWEVGNRYFMIYNRHDQNSVLGPFLQPEIWSKYFNKSIQRTIKAEIVT